METPNSKNNSDSKEKITFKPIKLEEIPPPSKEELKLMLMWNLKMFPFLLENYDIIFKEKEHSSNPSHTRIIHFISSDFCPNR